MIERKFDSQRLNWKSRRARTYNVRSNPRVTAMGKMWYTVERCFWWMDRRYRDPTNHCKLANAQHQYVRIPRYHVRMLGGRRWGEGAQDEHLRAPTYVKGSSRHSVFGKVMEYYIEGLILLEADECLGREERSQINDRILVLRSFPQYGFIGAYFPRAP